MAIYQFYLGVIPKVGLLKKHHEMPIEITTSTAKGYFESNIGEYWKIAEIDSKEIIREVDKIIERENWMNDEFKISWKIKTEQSDNDVWMSISEKSGNIEELSFRADLRENKLEFLIKMIVLGKKYDWLFMDRKGRLANPDFEEIDELIKNSNAYKFLKAPLNYLRGLRSDV